MKKLLTILLALLVVTGVVFAATSPSAADLYLTSTVTGYMKHGFFDAKASGVVTADGTYTTFDAIPASVSVVEENAKDVTLNTSNNIGFYNFWTNSGNNVTVMFALNSLTATTASGDKWFVPYKLSFTETEELPTGDDSRLSNGVLATLGDTTLGFKGESDTSIVAATEVFKTKGSGNWYISLALAADFNTTNLDVIPEGTYIGNIVATVTSP